MIATCPCRLHRKAWPPNPGPRREGGRSDCGPKTTKAGLGPGGHNWSERPERPGTKDSSSQSREAGHQIFQSSLRLLSGWPTTPPNPTPAWGPKGLRTLVAGTEPSKRAGLGEGPAGRCLFTLGAATPGRSVPGQDVPDRRHVHTASFRDFRRLPVAAPCLRSQA